MSETPVYTSKSTGKSLWQEYRVYDDHVEFGTLIGQMTVPFDQIERVDVSESGVKGLLRGDLHLKNFRPALKLDWADFLEHVVLDKSEGLMRRVRFTPDDPVAFKNALDEALSQYRRKKAASEA
jgi:hypothetical protein